jgi:hypothetical protein
MSLAERSRRGAGALAVAALLVAAAPGRAAAQAEEPTLAELSLRWAAGDWVSPVICPGPDGPRQVARALRVVPPRQPGHRPTHWIEIAPLRVPGPCKNALGAEEPDVDGRLRIGLPGRFRPDTASLDLQQALRREQGFRFDVLEGSLNLRAAGGARVLELGGGHAELRGVTPGSDAARILGTETDLPRRTLAIEAPDGTRLFFPLLGIPRR